MKPYGCSNKPRKPAGLPVQDGWHECGLQEHYSEGRLVPRQLVRIPIIRYIGSPFDISTCRYDKRMTDPGCNECHWQYEAPSNEQPA